MDVYIVEGKYDVYFLVSILKRHFDISVEDLLDYKLVLADKSSNKEFNRKINAVINYLTTDSYYHFIKATFGFIVYGDNGRETVIELVLPSIIFEVIEAIPVPEEVTIVTILDSDGVTLQKTIEMIRRRLENEIKRNHWDYQISKLEEGIKISSVEDYRYSILVQIIQIPESLEKQLINKSLDKLGLSEKQKNNIPGRDVHDALKYVSTIAGISVEDLVKKSVFEKWFDGEIWYNGLVQKIRERMSALSEDS